MGAAKEQGCQRLPANVKHSPGEQLVEERAEFRLACRVLLEKGGQEGVEGVELVQESEDVGPGVEGFVLGHRVRQVVVFRALEEPALSFQRGSELSEGAQQLRRARIDFRLHC